MNLFLIIVLIITFFLFTFRLLDIDESFDLKTDQSIDTPTVNGVLTANNGITVKGDSAIASQN